MRGGLQAVALCDTIEAMIELLDPVFRALRLLILAFPIWGPLFVVAVFVRVWIRYVQLKTIAGKEYVLLEVRLPQEVHRSPKAMELLLNAFHNPGEMGTWVKKYWKGNVVPWASLEIASFGGSIHFYVRIEKIFRVWVESQIYAQFPDAEIFEVEDYTMNIAYNENEYSMWIAEFKLTDPDPYPIATYVDYGLDKDPKEEQKVDPMTPMLEYFGAIQEGAQVWVQFVIRHHQKSPKGPWWKFEDTDKWKDDAKKEIEKIKKEGTIEGGDGEGDKIALTPGQRDKIEALERSIKKPAFDVGIRGAYIAKEDVFQKPQIGALINSFKQYSTAGYNGFKPNNVPGGQYPWSFIANRREESDKKGLLQAYRARGFFHPPYKSEWVVLNTEELATVYHFPGRIAQTATLPRIDSRKAEPPTNLPI